MRDFIGLRNTLNWAQKGTGSPWSSCNLTAYFRHARTLFCYVREFTSHFTLPVFLSRFYELGKVRLQHTYGDSCFSKDHAHTPGCTHWNKATLIGQAQRPTDGPTELFLCPCPCFLHLLHQLHPHKFALFILPPYFYQPGFEHFPHFSNPPHLAVPALLLYSLIHSTCCYVVLLVLAVHKFKKGSPSHPLTSEVSWPQGRQARRLSQAISTLHKTAQLLKEIPRPQTSIIGHFGKQDAV